MIRDLHPQAAFVLPQTFPVTRDTLNYAGVAVGIVMLGTVIFWFLPGGLGARKWYRGEIKTARVEFDSVRLRESPLSLSLPASIPVLDKRSLHRIACSAKRLGVMLHGRCMHPEPASSILFAC